MWIAPTVCKALFCSTNKKTMSLQAYHTVPSVQLRKHQTWEQWFLTSLCNTQGACSMLAPQIHAGVLLCFMIPPFTSWSVTHLVLMFMYRYEVGINVHFFYVSVQSLRYHLFKDDSCYSELQWYPCCNSSDHICAPLFLNLVLFFTELSILQ